MRRARNRVAAPLGLLRLLLVFAAAASSSALPGCGGSSEARPAVHPARGRVLLKGRPLAGALVVLHADPAPVPEGSVPRPVGRSDAEGRFALHTYLGEDGAPAGRYRLSISQPPRSGEGPGLGSKADAAPANLLGDRYFDPARSGLVAEIRAGANEIPPIDLPGGAAP